MNTLVDFRYIKQSTQSRSLEQRMTLAETSLQCILNHLFLILVIGK